MRYVVAFAGKRDLYQVPVALHRRRLLEAFITDFYSRVPSSRMILPRRLRRRWHPELPSAYAVSSIMALTHEVLGGQLGRHPQQVFKHASRHLSLKALRYAADRQAGLLLYGGVAHWAFTSPRSRGLPKCLFMFHPHVDTIERVLSADFRRFRECAWSMRYEEGTSPIRYSLLRDEWKRADFVLCTSQFTAETLSAAGCPRDHITVIPYGVAFDPKGFAAEKSRRTCEFLFVGQGVQRKGLHHLLRVWNRLKLPRAHLTVVASVLDPGIARLAAPDVTILGRQSRGGLDRLLERANVFLLPSLIEGFGLVYLEALAAGCHCIGTFNTGLPDIVANRADIATIIDAGSLEALGSAITDAYRAFEHGNLQPDAARQHAGTFSWTRFRTAVADAVESRTPNP
jgi:glycosyltransferase involved in cell wall biosynthesis